MRQELRPLYVMTTAVLLAGLVAGLAFAGLSDSAVLAGVVVLALLMFVLFGLGRREGSHHSDEQDHHFPTDVH